MRARTLDVALTALLLALAIPPLPYRESKDALNFILTFEQGTCEGSNAILWIPGGTEGGMISAGSNPSGNPNQSGILHAACRIEFLH